MGVEDSFRKRYKPYARVAWTQRASRKRDLAQRPPAGEAAADRGADVDGGEETAAAGGGANVGANAAGAAIEADEGENAERGGAREVRAPAKSPPRRGSAGAPAPPPREKPPPTFGEAAWRTPTRVRALVSPCDPPASQR